MLRKRKKFDIYLFIKYNIIRPFKNAKTVKQPIFNGQKQMFKE